MTWIERQPRSGPRRAKGLEDPGPDRVRERPDLAGILQERDRGLHEAMMG